jgi:acetoin utilization deacetylase AcuC-like enzyme
MSPQLKVYYSDHYTLPLTPEHRFPNEKYTLLKKYLLDHEILKPHELFASPVANFELLSLAHDPDYIRSVKDGSVAKEIIQRIGFPWSEALYYKASSTVGGAFEACKNALEYGIGGNLAGGTHHAHYDRGEGYCTFNDIAVVTQYLLKSKIKNRIAIIDLDVHQGNGNSSILNQNQNVFILSLHGEKNYPFKKVPSTMDIALADGTGDKEYLEALDVGLDAVKKFSPDYLFYQMGVDPLKEDALGKLSLTFDGLSRRDYKVLSYAKEQSIPISLALGGGYAKPIQLSVEAYANTYRVVRSLGW